MDRWVEEGDIITRIIAKASTAEKPEAYTREN